MIVVADTSVVLNLCCVQQEELLLRLYGRVCVPTQVASEFVRLTREDNRFSSCALPSWIEIVAVRGDFPLVVMQAQLDLGESAAISLYLELGADVLLMDESLGRAVADRLQIRTIGILGILLEARRLNFVPGVAQFLDRLEKEARFWISPTLRAQVLKLAGE